VTGPDIIFFWVARMIMAGLEFKQEIPFKHVYFTSIIRDVQGRKMSKSLGNSPDPLDVIATYGADALRFTVLYLAPIGQDVLYSNEKCEMGRNFANKIWNAGRFLLMNRAAVGDGNGSPARPSMDLSDRWILSRFHSTVQGITTAMEEYRVNDSVKMVYDFLWHDFCDWYVEFVKQRLTEADAQTKVDLVNRAIGLYEETLKLLHPFMPFVTEEIWQHLADRPEGASIMISPWPAANGDMINIVVEREMEFLQNVISSIRTIRSEMNIPPTKPVDVVINCHDASKLTTLEVNRTALESLAKVGNAMLGTDQEKPGYAASSVVQGQDLFVPLKGLIDLDVERSRLTKEIDRLEAQLAGVESKLTNPNFAGKAPADIIQKEKDKKENFKQTISKLQIGRAHV
jgi:valyl-tRNA synthetase